MGRASLLQTNTVTYQELVGNGRTFRVPPYQRDYSWTRDQWEDLWNDILDIQGDPDQRHYMGAIVVKAESDRVMHVIDGQQRLATLAILTLAVIGRLGSGQDGGDEVERNRERARALRSRYIGEKDPASLTEVSKLEMNASDNGLFQDYLVQLRRPASLAALTHSNRLLYDCLTYFTDRLADLAEQGADGATIAALVSEVVARRLLFILITVDDEVSAYTVFETLNARGLELTATDLLKNFLCSRIRTDSDLAAVQRRWQRLVATVRHEMVPEFLRYHYLTLDRRVRSTRLFQRIRTDVIDAAGVLRLLDRLEARAPLFEALGDASHGYWIDYPGAAQYVRALALFGARQMTPLLFAADERLTPTEFVKLLKLVVALTFRFTVVCRRSSNDLEPTYHDAARGVLDGSAQTARQVFDLLRPMYVGDAQFRAAFAQMSLPTAGAGRKVTKYILCRLESDAAGRVVDWETDPSSVEHILPENPIDAWNGVAPQAKWSDWAGRLGNLVLLEGSLNRDADQLSFVDKQMLYTRSAYASARELGGERFNDWTCAQIERRQETLAATACRLWRSDFADS
ncbi:MAG: DUF262 domain-containing HNH endonuclease family protein [Armatimonadetes bacterium]|nr:DUF262 domain-containing HNH endonuclease family protein [Armatimonadota bacterium]